MTDISDAYEASYTIMLNLNRSWITKQGDFFVESPIILLASIIWFLKIYQGGKYCTFPHAIEFLNKKYADTFTILTSYPELENYLSPFMDAWESNAQDQLQGQLASAKIPLSRMISPALYWVMTGDDFSLDINNPEEPKILVVGNNPDRQNIYSCALGLYNSRIVKLINKKHQLKSSVIIDELPTIYFRGLDNLIATARSNKVAVCLGFQDFSQLRRDYGDKESKYSINSLVYWVTYVHNVVYSFYRSMIYCYINSTQRCAGSIVIDIIPTNGADKRKFFPFAPYFPVTNVIKRYFYPYFPAIIGIKGYSFPYFPYLSGIMKIKTALYSLFSRLDWHKTVVFPCLGEIYEGIRSLSWEIPVT